MTEIYLKLIPVLLTILAGFLLKQFKVLTKDDASIILKLTFYIGLPALILANIPNTRLETDYIFLPVIPAIIGVILYFISLHTGKRLNIEKKTLGVFVVSSLIINTAFAFPFVIALHGQEGLIRILVLDMGNAVLIYGFAYYQACKYGNHQVNQQQLIKRFIGAIPLWSILIALLLNFFQIKISGPVFELFKTLGDTTIPLLLLSVGIMFDAKIIKVRTMGMALLIRMGFGMLLGLLLSYLFGLEGITKQVVILATATPIGYNTLTFSSLENLESEFAAALVSISILIALVYVPVIILFLN